MYSFELFLFATNFVCRTLILTFFRNVAMAMLPKKGFIMAKTLNFRLKIKSSNEFTLKIQKGQKNTSVF
jgi:hypothetical protein